MDSLTAKVSCFAMAYHHRENEVCVFDDWAAYHILGEEYDMIAKSMTDGISFFMPEFEGSREEGLRLIVEQQLAPSVLARSAYCEDKLKTEMKLGCRQYVIIASGYDTFGIRERENNIDVYELDLPDVLEDKKKRIENAGLESISGYVPCNLSLSEWKEKLISAGYMKDVKSIASMLGIVHYLTKEEFQIFISEIGSIMTEGSAICMDYPVQDEGREARINRRLAQGAGEEMKAIYESSEIELLLSSCGFLVYENVRHDELTDRYFRGTSMKVPFGTACLLAVKKG